MVILMVKRSTSAYSGWVKWYLLHWEMERIDRHDWTQVVNKIDKENGMRNMLGKKPEFFLTDLMELSVVHKNIKLYIFTKGLYKCEL